MRKRILIATLALSVSCVQVEQGNAFIEAVLQQEAPDCDAEAGGEFAAGALLDLGRDANGLDAGSLVLPLQVRTNLASTFSSSTLSRDQQASPNFQNFGNTDSNIITFQTSEIFFSTDADRGDEFALQNEGTPVNDNTARRNGVSGVAFNEQTQLLTESVVFTTAIGKQDAAALAAEPFIAEQLVNSQSRARITLNIRLEGTTTGGAFVRTPPFFFGVDLCRGCLIPECASNQSAVPGPDGICEGGGQNAPLVCE